MTAKVLNVVVLRNIHWFSASYGRISSPGGQSERKVLGKGARVDYILSEYAPSPPTPPPCRKPSFGRPPAHPIRFAEDRHMTVLHITDATGRHWQHPLSAR